MLYGVQEFSIDVEACKAIFSNSVFTAFSSSKGVYLNSEGG